MGTNMILNQAPQTNNEELRVGCSPSVRTLCKIPTFRARIAEKVRKSIEKHDFIGKQALQQMVEEVARIENFVG